MARGTAEIRAGFHLMEDLEGASAVRSVRFPLPRYDSEQVPADVRNNDLRGRMRGPLMGVYCMVHGSEKDARRFAVYMCCPNRRFGCNALSV